MNDWWVVVDGRTFTNLIDLVKFISKQDGYVKEGSTVQAKQQAASVIKNTRIYIATINEPRTRAEWNKLVQHCLRMG